MYFASMSEFWHMGGHGFYVWVAYGISTIVLGGIVLKPLFRRRYLLDQQWRRLNRETAAGGEQQTAR